MPELPEVETTRAGIEPLVAGKTIQLVSIHNASLRWPVEPELRAILPGHVVRSVSRRSKYLLFDLDHGTLIVHLGMTGHLRCVEQDSPCRKHDHFELIFSDGTALRYNDSRRFGAILWTTFDPLRHERLVSLGPEPLTDDFSAEHLYKLSRNRKVAIKSFLMTAEVVVGVGNIYANEALYRAGILPHRPAGKLGRQAYRRLVKNIKDVLAEAIASGGTTIRDFSDSQGRPGYFKQELKVYGRQGQSCFTCDRTIRMTRVGQRSTYYCPGCQG